MPKNIGTHMGNRFYTTGSMPPAAKAVSPYIYMRRSEAAIKAVVIAAGDPKVVGFPVRLRFSRKKRAPA